VIITVLSQSKGGGVRRISFNTRFVNEAGNDLVSGEIHTIRQNYDFWKRFEDQDAALFTWEGKPYRSTQRVFSIKRIVSVQKIVFRHRETADGYKIWPDFFIKKHRWFTCLDNGLLSENDGFEDETEFEYWFYEYPDGDRALIHFTNFRY
jgi:hypothetical protein